MDIEHYNKTTSLIFQWMRDTQTATPKALYRMLDDAGLFLKETPENTPKANSFTDDTITFQGVTFDNRLIPDDFVPCLCKGPSHYEGCPNWELPY